MRATANRATPRGARPVPKKRRRLSIPRVVTYIVMTLLVVFMALPLVYIISTAFKPLDELFLFPPRFFVKNPTVSNLFDLFTSLSGSEVPFLRYALNSAIVSVCIVSGTCLVCSMGAYGMVKFHPPGSKIIFTVIVAALMFSPHVTQIPRYLVVNALGIIDTYIALVFPAIAVAYNFFLMKQFVDQFPDELLEAARLDGAGEMFIFGRIVVPAMKPVLATLIVFSFVSSWNDYFSSLIYTTSQQMKTLPLALQTISGGAGTASIGRAGAVAASALVMTLPPIVIFVIMQSKVMDTMVYSGIKG